MTTIFFDSPCADDERRRRLYQGDLFVYSATEGSRSFCDFAREMIAGAFNGDNPETAQDRLRVDDYVQILTKLKPAFIHHPESKRFVGHVLSELGYDTEQTYFDVPRMRSSTSNGYLTSGIAYAWHPHRDTWYSAPSAQINVWIPIYDILSENTMAFHPRYFDQYVPNDSSRYNYYEWNSKHRANAAAQVGKDTRPLPGPTEAVELESQVRVVCPVGGVVLFSGAQLHSSVPNTSGKTRFSIDFRIVNITDIEGGRGAPMQDVQCTGSNIRDFMRASDLEPMPQNIVDMFNDGTEAGGDLIYQSNLQSR